MTTHANDTCSFLLMLTPGQSECLTTLAQANGIPFDKERDIVAIDVFADNDTFITTRDLPNVLKAIQMAMNGQPEASELPTNTDTLDFDRKREFMQFAMNEFAWVDYAVDQLLYHENGGWEDVRIRYPALLPAPA